MREGASERESSQQVYERVPPQSLEAEAAVLGSMLVDSQAAVVALRLLKPEDFYKTSHADVFGAMVRLFMRSEPIDLTTVADQLERFDKLKAVGGRTFLAEIADNVGTAAHIEHHCEILREYGRLRRTIHVCADVMERSYKKQEDAEDLILDGFAKMTAIVSDGTQGLRATADYVDEDFAAIMAWQKGQGKPHMLAFGMPMLDHRTGMPIGHLSILAGRPSQGKTSFGLQTALNVALVEKSVAIFSLELTEPQVRLRMLSQMSGVEEWKFKNEQGLCEQEHNSLVDARDKMRELPIYLNDTAAIGVADIRMRIHERFGAHPPALIVIDYIQEMKHHGRLEKRYEQVTQIVRDLRIMAKEFNCVVLALSQFSREIDKEKRAPRLSDLSESGGLEQNARLILGLHRPMVEDKPDRAGKIHIMKNNFGSVGSVPIVFHGATYTFVEGELGTPNPAVRGTKRLVQGAFPYKEGDSFP